MTPECPREQELISVLVAGRWPDGCEESLRQHAGECASCTGLVDLLTLLRAERDDLHEGVSVPAAGQIWWRAAIRARLEATQTVTRPFSWLFGTAGACAVGLLLASVGLLWPFVHSTLVGMVDASSMFAGLARVSGLVALGLATFLILAPLALYLALSDE